MRARVAARLVLLLAAGFMVGAAPADYSPPSTDAFLHGIRGYPFLASAARREKIRAGVPALVRCMAATEVRRLLGDPDFGYVAFKAGGNGKVPAINIWNYVLEKKSALESEPGSRVVVWFDVVGKLTAVTVHGAPDIESTVSRRGQECPQ